MNIALPDLRDLDMESVLEHSYKDYHVKGFDYLCLHRSEGLTLKAYFFEGDVQNASEVVNPHNHRYDFHTTCLSGAVENRWYRSYPFGFNRDTRPQRYNMFEWRTPLNGGDGFTLTGEITLQNHRSMQCSRGEGYEMAADELHTIQILEPDTVLLLVQHEDVVPVNQPTLTFTQSVEPPDLPGLYNKFNADQAVKRIKQLQELAKP
ncbi:hypothetical protein BKG70_00745 [Mycobacteroides chelonae]|uniref:hypothetical protein n=1 Tax=Mycobacteroides chelonae TaxID=1774 RepID=UPI0008A94C9A|nr:hypothetical protein [Mycobacteroides chelonae]OHT91294.1 hypothetical protein BKG70_00745 [Mycobacteroides chelonae]